MMLQALWNSTIQEHDILLQQMETEYKKHIDDLLDQKQTVHRQIQRYWLLFSLLSVIHIIYHYIPNMYIYRQMYQKLLQIKQTAFQLQNNQSRITSNMKIALPTLGNTNSSGNNNINGPQQGTQKCLFSERADLAKVVEWLPKSHFLLPKVVLFDSFF